MGVLDVGLSFACRGFFFFFSHSHDLRQTPQWWVGFNVG